MLTWLITIFLARDIRKPALKLIRKPESSKYIPIHSKKTIFTNVGSITIHSHCAGDFIIKEIERTRAWSKNPANKIPITQKWNDIFGLHKSLKRHPDIHYMSIKSYDIYLWGSRAPSAEFPSQTRRRLRARPTEVNEYKTHAGRRMQNVLVKILHK